EVAPRLLAVGALLGRSLSPGQVVSGVDQGDVRKGLRKISDLAREARVEFLSEQSDIVAQRQQTLEELARLVDAPQQDVVVGQPKAAGQKGPFAGRHAVLDLSGVVAHDEAVDEEVLLDRLDGSDDARIGRWKKPDQREQQQARVEGLLPVGLDKAAEIRIKPVPADIPMNIATYPPQPVA